MNPVFEIIPEYIEPLYTNLICEISEDSLTYFYQNEKDKKINGLSLYELPERFSNAEFSVKDILDEKQILRKSYNKVIISYSFSEFALVPYSMYTDSEKSVIIDTLYGAGTEKMILNDNLADFEIHNYYSIPLYIHYYVISHFPLAKFNHQITNIIRNNKSNGTEMEIVFHKRKMVCALWIENKLQIANSFFFVSAEDVVFHLLNICKQFKLPPTINLLIRGMIDVDSALAEEIKKYFAHISYRNHDASITENLEHLPSHYFSHLLSLA